MSSSISHATSSLQHTEDLAAAAHDARGHPTFCSLSAHHTNHTQYSSLLRGCGQAPSEILRCCYSLTHHCPCAAACRQCFCHTQAQLGLRTTLQPPLQWQALASFSLQEQDLLVSHSFPRLALALCTLQETGPAKSLTAVEGTVPPFLALTFQRVDFQDSRASPASPSSAKTILRARSACSPWL